MTKFTPGPWNASATTSSEFVTRAIYGNDGKTLVGHIGVPGYSKSPEDPAEDVANARLIVAAPELLEALRAINTWLICPSLDPKDLNYFWELTGKAIAKAEGK